MYAQEQHADVCNAVPVIRTLLLNRDKRDYTALREMIGEYCKHIHIVGTATSAEGARELIAEERPDALFFDSGLSDTRSYELLQVLRLLRVAVVFVGTCERHALQAIKASAIDYLLKPITSEDIRDVEGKLLQCTQRQKSMPNAVDNYQDIVHSLLYTGRKDRRLQKIILNHARGFNCIDMDTIVRLEAARNYTLLVLNTQKNIVVSRSLSTFETVLDMDVFSRIHKSHIVNLNYMSGYVYDEAGYVVMNGGKKIEIARRRLHSFLEHVQRLTK